MIKVMSFNIRTAAIDDGEHAWEARKALVADRIRDFAPDLLGLQECRDDEQAQFIRQSLPGYGFHGVHREGGDDTALEMAPLLLREASFALIREGHFWLSETPPIAGSRSWGSAFARTASWVELLHRPTARTLIFLNTHLDYEPAAVDGGARLLRQWLDENAKSSAVIVTGDFNAGKQSYAYGLLAADGTPPGHSSAQLMDSFRAGRHDEGDDISYHGYGQAPDAGAIDWILISRHFLVMDARVDHSRPNGRYPSDHDPVIAVLDWQLDWQT